MKHYVATIFAFVVFGATGNVAMAQNLQFPMQGKWFVLQGPPCPGRGNHCQTISNRLAYDLIPINQFGQPYPPGCIGQPIKSPSDGVVVEALNMYSNIPNPMQHVAGNHVVIQRSPNEFITIAHLSPGSLLVGVGAHVSAGQVIGTCGFNGNTTAPHVHIHMQAGPNILNYNTPPLPMHFNVRVITPMGCMPLGGNIMTMGMVTC